MTGLPASRLVGLFLLGAILGPLGDHVHVATGTTTYFSDAVPFVWDSPLWFPIAVGLGTAALADIRVPLGAVRSRPDGRWVLGALPALMATYASTGLLRGTPDTLGLVLIGGIAIVVWSVIGDARSIVCGALAAVVGTGVEAALAAADLFEYAGDSDALFGVAVWLPALYFTFGVASAVLGEWLAGAAEGSRDSRPGRP